MSKAWGGKISSWAAEAEAAEAEELASSTATSFPTLRQSATLPKQKKKPIKLSLQEFTESTGPTPAQILRLPTGPSERGPEETGREGRWGGVGRREERRPLVRNDRDGLPDLPSRADGVDNWAMGKKNLPSVDSGRGSKYESLGGGSRADDVDNWGAGKRVSTFGSRADTQLGGGGGGGFGAGGSRADEVDNWGAGKRVSTFGSRADIQLGGGGGGFGAGGSRADDVANWGAGKRVTARGFERTRLVLDPPKKEVGGGTESSTLPVKTNKPNPFGAARPREEVLAEKGLDWKKMESNIEAKKSSSRPTSSHSNRPTSSQSNRSESVGVDGAVKARPKVNPFGDAKPREVLLEEKGLDWRKIDLDLDRRRVDRDETEGEKFLKEEIDHLKKELSKNSASDAIRESHEGETAVLQDKLLNKERDLELLIRELDDKVRFNPRVNERPGSGAGRVSGPHSQSESFDENPRNMEFMERPRSRGNGDMQSRQSDDRRDFQGGMERGFMRNRGMDRPRSRERW